MCALTSRIMGPYGISRCRWCTFSFGRSNQGWDSFGLSSSSSSSRPLCPHLGYFFVEAYPLVRKAFVIYDRVRGPVVDEGTSRDVKGACSFLEFRSRSKLSARRSILDMPSRAFHRESKKKKVTKSRNTAMCCVWVVLVLVLFWRSQRGIAI